jgi:metal-dependent amidase/aminoacylase/carboxypeptidase family protein
VKGKTKMMTEQIAKMAEQLRSELVEIRRDIYMHPELSGQEERTADIVAQKLRELGLEVTSNVGGHGVIGLLKGELPGSVVAWRADMDAFPIEDALDVPYKSRVPGVKHVCGHDVHTTVGLGIAKVLASMRDQIPGQIKFIFQPAEEIIVGAKAVIAAGGLTDPQPDAILALHVAPFDVGKIGCVPGTALPGVTNFHVTFNADFDELPAPYLLACLQAILSLNTLGFPSSAEELSQFLEAMVTGSDALDHFVAIMGWIPPEEGKASTCRIDGMVRAANEGLRTGIPVLIQQKLDDVLAGTSITYELDYPAQMSFPATLNDSELEERLRLAIERSIGAENTMIVRRPFPFNSEDFAYYQQKLPGVLYWLGGANYARGIISVPHLPNFDVDEECLVVGVKAMSNVLLEFLEQHK